MQSLACSPSRISRARRRRTTPNQRTDGSRRCNWTRRSAGIGCGTRCHAERVRVWVDIENEPQVQYLVPLLDACRRRGAETIVTARDYGSTFRLLADREVDFDAIGAAYGGSKVAKVRGLAARTRRLTSFLRGAGRRPDTLVSASRAATLAARRLGIRSFFVSDYEHANLTVFRLAGATVLFPEVIPREAYRRSGFRDDRLIAFNGLKEDLTFAGIRLEEVEAAPLDGSSREDVVRALVRPPAEQSHYYTPRSRALYLDALRQVARNDRAVVVLAPRYEWQRHDLESLAPANPPIVLTEPVPFLPLLRAVDLVLCSGGTMLREAAYLGVPAYSLLASEIGAVDRYLERIGRAVLISASRDLGEIQVRRLDGWSPLAGNPTLVDEIADLLVSSPSG
jgi:predicted glycosyltransferase